MSHETELKLLLSDIDERDRIAQALGKRVARVEQSNAYFDTEDDALSRHRWAVRVRHSNDQTVLTLKGEGRSDGEFTVRVELERTLAADAWPLAIRGELDVAAELESLLTEAGHALPADVDLSSLEKLGVMSNIRSVFPLKGTALMVELDETEYPDFSLRYEAELEVPDGEDRDAGVRALREVFDEAQVPWRPSTESKYARFRESLSGIASG
ncbi:MAG: CYTH domain-containing protein [Myxococcota bacterium]